MNDQILVQELAAVLVAPPYADLAALFTRPEGGGPQIYASQAAAGLARPTLTLSVAARAYTRGRVGTLACEIRSRVGDDLPTSAHQGLVSALSVALLGTAGESFAATASARADAKAALKAALLARGKVEMLDYGFSGDPVRAEVLGEDLRTTVRLRVAWLFRATV